MPAKAHQTAADVRDDLNRIFDLQRAHQWNMKATTAAERKARLQKLKEVVEAHADEIVAAVRADTRKPEPEVKMTEVLNVLGNIDRNIANLEEWMKPTEVPTTLNPADNAHIVHEARGVCLILGPWNFPLGLVMGPIAAAIAAGNCCMVKLSDLTPHTAEIAAKIISEAFPEAECAVLEGRVEVATALLAKPFNHIFFTGSTRVGKLVMAAAAQHLATVTLELGGKSPVVVDRSADLKKVGTDLASAKQFNGGQACISPDYVLINEAQQAELIEAFQSTANERLTREDGSFNKDGIAQIVNPQNFARIKALFDDAIAKGATVAVGGMLDEADRTIQPTLLTGVTPDMQILQEEIFGPVIPVMSCDSVDDAVSYIESRDKPLALYIYSEDQGTIEKVLQRTSSGGVTINGVFSHYLENNLPFGGVNQSGMGSYHGYFGFKAFSHERAVYRHTGQ